MIAEPNPQGWPDDGPEVHAFDVDHTRGLHATPLAECAACVTDYNLRHGHESQELQDAGHP
jgi:hypothetical protein